jgi:HD-GYP domain-containing protein (c-di-GMP phosphodiesterase class II)
MIPNSYHTEQRRREDARRRWMRAHEVPAEASSVRVARLLRTLATGDPAVWHHGQRVAWFAIRIGAALDVDLAQLYLAGLLHDIGKLALPADLLAKPDALTPAEQTWMRMHPDLGAAVLPQDRSLAVVYAGVRYHHERWDGAGYPTGLRGEAIPLAARILAIADSLDAICMDRPYRPRRPFSVALDTVSRAAGQQFDPALVEIAVRALAKNPAPPRPAAPPAPAFTQPLAATAPAFNN